MTLSKEYIPDAAGRKRFAVKMAEIRKAEIMEEGKNYRSARKLLYAKYRQYKALPLKEKESVIIKMKPVKAVSWGL